MSVTTANGFDQRWIDAINATLEDRGAPIRVEDLMPEAWDQLLGPLVDQMEDQSKLGVYRPVESEDNQQ